MTLDAMPKFFAIWPHDVDSDDNKEVLAPLEHIIITRLGRGVHAFDDEVTMMWAVGVDQIQDGTVCFRPAATGRVATYKSIVYRMSLRMFRRLIRDMARVNLRTNASWRVRKNLTPRYELIVS